MEFHQNDYLLITVSYLEFFMIISLADYRKGTDDSSWLWRSEWKSISLVWIWTGNKLRLQSHFWIWEI